MSTTVAPDKATKTTGPKKAVSSDRSRAENRLGLKLVAPAVIFMLVVTAWPMLQALYLSMFRYRLTAPDDREFIGLSNYATVLGDSLFWQDTFNTVLIMVVTVAVELVIGFAFAMVMHRVIFARGVIRTSILIPYGIITVVSAFAWQFAFSLNNGFINNWLPFVNEDFNWFGDHWPAMFAIMVSEIRHVADGHADRLAGVGHGRAAHQTVGRLHRDGADHAVADVQRDLEDQRLGLTAQREVHGELVVHVGHRVHGELDVDDGAGDAGDTPGATGAGVLLGLFHSGSHVSLTYSSLDSAQHSVAGGL